MTDSDQEQARIAASSKQPARSSPDAIKVPGKHLSTGNREIDALVYQAAQRFRLDPCLIVSVMMAESGYNRHAVSPRGASGLMQLMPATAVRFGVKDIFDPEQNVTAGASYLRWLLDRFGGDIRLALAGYNAGEGAVEIYGNRIPPFLETQNYVRTIYSTYSRVHPSADPDREQAVLSRFSANDTPGATHGSSDNPTYNQIIRFTSTGDTVAVGSTGLKDSGSSPK